MKKALFVLAFVLASSVSAGTIKTVTAIRDGQNGMVISGTVALPVGTKLMVTLKKPGSKQMLGQSDATVSDASSSFTTQGFGHEGSPWPDGTYDVELVAYFTQVFGQPASVLSTTGDNGASLPADSDLKPDDKEFPKAGKHLQVIKHVKLTSSARAKAEMKTDDAIQAVRHATLTVQGKGRSADNIDGCLELFKRGGGFEPQGWNATFKAPVWIVTLSYLDGGNAKTGDWSYNPKTQAVKYLDPNSKMLSWTPSTEGDPRSGRVRDLPLARTRRLFLARCDKMLAAPPGRDWDGVFAVQHK